MRRCRRSLASPRTGRGEPAPAHRGDEPRQCRLTGSRGALSIDQRGNAWPKPRALLTSFLAADDAAYEAAGTEATNAAMEAAMDVVSEAEDAVENFPARSFADLVVIAGLAKVQIGLESISDDFCGILANHILALSTAET